MSDGEKQETVLTVGDLAKVVRSFSLTGLKSAFMVAQLDEDDGRRASAYEDCWRALSPYAGVEAGEAQKLLEASGPEKLDEAPASLREAKWEYVWLRGRPDDDEVVFGWVVRLGRPATVDEKFWFHTNGFKYAGYKWTRPDQEEAVVARAG